MKVTLFFRKGLVEKAVRNVLRPPPVIQSANQRKMLLIAVLLSHIFCSASFSQETTVFLSRYDSCHIPPPSQKTALRMEALSISSPQVRVAYVIPSNRTEQPNGVAFLQNAIKIGQQWYKAQMEQNGFGAKTYVFETEADGVTPLVHVVHVNETDDFLRGDIWGRTIQAASNAGISVWASGELWVLIPEAHLMQPDGAVIGGTALGSGFGSGNSPGVAMIGSNALPLFQPGMITDDTPYDGKVVPDLGPFPMKQDVTFAEFEGTTFSSLASSWQGALLHEIGHAFGLAHDYRNDTNFHGNLMFNGFRGIRGSLFPERYPQDFTRLEYASSMILNVSHYFNTDKILTSSPDISYANSGSVIPQQGLVHIAFQTSDTDSLSLALLRYRGDAVAEMALEGTEADTAFAVPYFTQGDTNPYTIAVYDKEGNLTNSNLEFNVPGGYNQAPVPFVRVDPPAPGLNQLITLNASGSFDIDHDQSSLVVAWDVDNDGQFDTEPSTNKTVQYRYEIPGNYLMRLKVTDPVGAQTISTPVSIKIPGERKISIESFTLINADNDEAVADLQEGMVINHAAWKGKTFNIRANISPGMIDRVEFKLTGPITHAQIEKVAPYALFGDSPQGNFSGKKLLPGEYTLTATPFSSSGKGIALTVSFKVKVKEGVPGQATVLTDKTIGGTSTDYPHSAISTLDGGYLLIGYSTSNASGDKSENDRGSGDYWIVKTDAQYNKLWDKTFGGDNIDEAHSVISTPDGGYMLAGSSQSGQSGDKSQPSNGGSDYWLIKIDNQGNKVWDKAFGGGGTDVLLTTISTSDGGYLLGGFSESDASGDKSENGKGAIDYWIVKIDSQGNKIWDKTVGGGASDDLRSIIPTDGAWLLFGNSDSNASGDKSENSKGSNDYWVVKIDNEGNTLWDKTIGGSEYDNLGSAILTHDEGYLLIGSSGSNASGDKSDDDKGNGDYWAVKIDKDGNKLWDKTIGGINEDVGSSAISIPAGGYLLAGHSSSNASGDKSENGQGDLDYWVIKIDDQGNKIWDKTIGGSAGDVLTSVIHAAEGHYLLAGYSLSDASGDKSENNKGEGIAFPDFWIVELEEPTSPVTMSLTLMNAHTDQEIKELEDGDTIRLSEVGNRLNIRANITAERIQKVAFDLRGPITHHRTDKKSPYALFDDHHGDFNSRKLLPGAYILTVTPYSKDTALAVLTISFAVTDGFAISGFTLIDTELDQPVGALSEGDVIDLSLLKDHKLSVRADTQPMHLDKVVLTLQKDRIVYARTEQYYPYSLFGNITAKHGSTHYIGVKFFPGTYTLTAIPYAAGVRGTPHAITFAVIRGGTPEAGCLRVEVYPVPTSGVINIAHEGKIEEAYIILLDYNGKVLLNRPLSQQPVEQLDVSAFRKGIHFLKVVSPEGVQIIRLVVE